MTQLLCIPLSQGEVYAVILLYGRTDEKKVTLP